VMDRAGQGSADPDRANKQAPSEGPARERAGRTDFPAR
jgi:hypothetical protein